MTDLIQRYVDKAAFTELFVEGLGWNRPKGALQTIDFQAEDAPLSITKAASYKGITVWTCPIVPNGRIQRLIDQEIRRESDERLLIFFNAVRQEWRWPQSRDVAGSGPSRLILHEHTVDRNNPALAQRLEQIRIGLDDEDVTAVEMKRRLRRAFDAERITNTFYLQFKNQHERLCSGIRGIDPEGQQAVSSDVQWYGSLLLNRVMFIYFMQKKRFLDNDPDYLRNRLARIQRSDSAKSPGTFYEFFKHFLLPLFHQGLGSPASTRSISDPYIADLVGDIPYINGGIFAVHPLEAAYNISIADNVFVEMFAFLDSWQWHLDSRPTGDPNEINPDVLGYIFEQFVNNKDKGAYYTREDITQYMTGATLLPVFLERFVQVTRINPWLNLAEDPLHYMPEGLRFGLENSVPDWVSAETSWPRPRWGEECSPDFGLPGETWWECIARRERATQFIEDASAGRISSVNNLVTYNVDIQRLTVDAIDRLDSPEDVLTAWTLLSRIRILDPTCGSGAFLFAALQSLEELYGAILDGVERHALTARQPDLQALATSVQSHPSRTYFILKHAMLNNLYGVDIMPEAIETARLRLFLKLVSAVDNRSGLEPLPDLDFNIRPGNVLVGALRVDSIESEANLFGSLTAASATEVAKELASTYVAFQNATESGSTADISRHRDILSQTLSETRAHIDLQYYRSTDSTVPLEDWLTSYRPFHWFVEFPGAMLDGGFDVVVGNPPYVTRRNLREYTYSGFHCDTAPDIFAPCFERAIQVTKNDGRIAMLVPISSQFSSRYTVLRDLVSDEFPATWVSAFDRRPSTFFTGDVAVRNSIWVAARTGESRRHVTVTHRWQSNFRPFLFDVLAYVAQSEVLSRGGWIRYPSVGMRDLLEDLMLRQKGNLGASVRTAGAPLRFKGNALYFLSLFVDPPPLTEADGSTGTPTMMSTVNFESVRLRDAALAVGLSKLAFVWWFLTSDNLNVTKEAVEGIPIYLDALPKDVLDQLSGMGVRLQAELQDNISFSRYRGRLVGRFDIPNLRNATDDVDLLLAQTLGYEDRLGDLELAYAWAFKGTEEDD